MFRERLLGPSGASLALALALAVAPPSAGRANDAPAPSDPAGIARHIQNTIRQQVGALAPSDSVPADARTAPSARPAAPGARVGRPASAVAGAGAASTDSADAWSALRAGNERFVSGHTLARPGAAERAGLVAGQRPLAVVLGCSDSGVGPERVFDQSLGRLFVVRTAGNVADPVVIGSIEYAVEHLHVPLVVVLAHEHCGAVQAAAAPKDSASANLQVLLDHIRPTVQRLSACFEGDELVQRSAIANARQTAKELASGSAALKRALGRGELRIAVALYHLGSGEVSRIE